MDKKLMIGGAILLSAIGIFLYFHWQADPLSERRTNSPDSTNTGTGTTGPSTVRADASGPISLKNIRDELAARCDIRPKFLHINLPRKPGAKLGVLHKELDNELVPYSYLSKVKMPFEESTDGEQEFNFVANGSVDDGGYLGVAVGEAEFSHGKQVKVDFKATKCKFSNFLLKGLEDELNEQIANQMIKDIEKLWIVTRIAEGEVDYKTTDIKKLEGKAESLKNSILAKAGGNIGGGRSEERGVKTNSFGPFVYELRPIKSIVKDTSLKSGAVGYKIDLGED